MQPGVDDPEVRNHFTVAIYPFFHTLVGKRAFPRLEALEERWRPWWSRLNDEELAEALEATSFFLPYVRSLLYPETALLRNGPAGQDHDARVQRLRNLSEKGPVHLLRELPAGPVLRLTASDAVHAELATFTVVRRSAGRERADLSARLEWADAVLFPSGVGFLLLRARLAEERPRLSELIRLNRVLRLVHPPTVNWTLPLLQLRDGETLHVRELLDRLLQGLAADSSSGHPGVAASGYTATEAGRAYGEHCQLLSYACLGLTPDERGQLRAGVFPSGMSRVLFEFAASIGLGETIDNPVWVPSRRQAVRLSRDNGLALWHCWEAMTLKESLTFLGAEDLRFTREVLPRLIETNYLPLYLYTLYQKFQLSVFADDLMREVAQVEGHLRGARALLRRFVAFRNRFWFSEVTRKPQGGDLYRALQQGLEVTALYQQVTASVKEAKEYYEDRWDRQVRLVVTTLGLVCGPLAAAAGATRYLCSALGPGWAATVLLGLAAVTGTVVCTLRLGRRRPAAGRKRPPRQRLRLWPTPNQGQGPPARAA